MVFRLKKAIFEGRELPLSLDKHRGEKNRFTVIVGKNGVGKSRLLSNIANTFRSLDPPAKSRALPRRANNSPQDFTLYWDFHGSEFIATNYRGVSYIAESSYKMPRKVICTSVSPFDKFPINRKPASVFHEVEDFENTSSYRYLGAKNHLGQFSSKSQLNRFIESLFLASRKSKAEVQKLSDVFGNLGYVPVLTTLYKVVKERPAEELLSAVLSNAKSFKNFIQTRSKNIRNQRISHIVNSSETITRMRKILTEMLGFENDRRHWALSLNFAKNPRLYSDERFRDISILTRLKLIYLHDVYLYKKESKQEIAIKDMSSGEQCVVVTMLGIASEISDDTLICIDEPEISLHPEWQETYIEWLQQTFDQYYGCHFILATHSPQILSRLESENSAVLLMDVGTLHPAKEYVEQSADYQLVQAFQTPGFRNEYLIREALTVYSNLSDTGKVNAKYSETLRMLVEILPKLDKADPVRKLIRALQETND
jgi:predicted ATP-binding protein involved in virulence